MSKVIGYKTNCCGKIFEEHHVEGLKYEHDMFDLLNSYSPVKPSKSNIHFCSTCYVEQVNDVAAIYAPKNKNRQLFEEKVKELRYIFFKKIFGNNLTEPK